MYLFFDTETTGLPKNYKAPVTDTNNWPRLVQIAWELYDEDEKLLESKMYIVKPVEFEIPTVASKIHNVTHKRAMEEGKDLIFVLNEFRNTMLKAKYLIAHNISFDEKIIGCEFIRMKMEKLPFKLIKIDTMKTTVKFCQLPAKWGFKWPKLNELHEKLFDVGFDGAHDALVDVKALAKCYFELTKRNVLENYSKKETGPSEFKTLFGNSTEPKTDESLDHWDNLINN